MRLWEDANRRLYTDEQLLRHVAHFGSLEAALEQGNIRLVAESSPKVSRGVKGQRRRLSDYLEGE